ncbi:hypothetical protein [Streptomyces sp. Wb2n-11]|uniref:hypothetical protein n=1 Tax=Streptomyces sp. Wb2n-11 TaxID=1030533 RepID=UPI000ABE7A2D|nr:hypothetical protein [Streptomyces sp. Wb2n-11]
MTPRTRVLPLALTVAAAVLTASCTSASDEPDHKPPTTAVSTPPPATGAGPYPDPVSPTPAPERSRAAKIKQPKDGIPSPDDVDQKDAGAVSRAALQAMLTFDTTVDTGRTEASVRAADAGWCTPAYAAKLRSATSRSGPGAAWNSWATHRAYTTVELTPADEAGRPADTATTAYRQWAATITPRGRDRWTGEPEMLTAFVELTRSQAGAPWRVNSLSLQ